MEKKPIKRDKNIQPLSRDHHHTLLLCWKIRKGFSKGIEVERIKIYSDWLFENHVLPHFELEEEYLFPVLDGNHVMVKKALAEHRRLERLFREKEKITNALSLIEEELELHVRFEERELFNEIQKQASPDQLKIISKVHKDERFQDNTADEFWK